MAHRWLYSRWIALVAGLGAGALVGLAVYWGSLLTGAGLFTLCGTVAGGVAALVFYTYRRTARLTELTVSIPHLTDFTFAVTSSNEGVAWRLFIESATRISAQPLAGAGAVREALDSLHVLFGNIREILLETQPTTRNSGVQTVEHLAIGMLNVQMRPFLAKWHPILTDWRRHNADAPESEWPQNGECREELERMRKDMLQYTRALGQLAGAQNIDSMLGAFPTS